MKNLARIAFISLAVAAAHSPAMAMVTLDLFGSGVGSVPSQTFSNSGQSVTVSGDGANVFLTNFGVGVAGGSTAVDPGETLVLDFTPAPVSFLESVAIDVTGAESGIADFALFADGSLVGTFNVDFGLSTINLGGVAGSVFDFVGLAGDSFYLRSVVVDPLQMAAPGTWMLMLIGAVGLGAARRRRLA